jgi:hypothetical protein
VLCGTSTPGVIRYNGPNIISLGVVYQSSNSQCYTISSVGTGPETVGTLLTQFVSCEACQVAPPPTTTSTSTSTSTSTTTSTSTSTTTSTSTSTSTSTTTTTTTAQEWYEYTLTPVTGGTCDATGPSIPVYKHLSGGPIETGDVLYASQNINDELASGYYSDGSYRYESSTGIVTDKTACFLPPTTTTTSTTAPPPGLYEFKVEGGTQTAPDACLLGSPGTYTVYSTDPNPANNATLYTTNYVDEGTIFTANNLAQYWPGLEYPDNSGTFNGAFIVIRKADQTAYYYNCLDLAGVRYCSGYCGG